MEMKSMFSAAMMVAAIWALPAGATSLGEPEGPVLVTFSGAITEKNNGDLAEFDRAMLEKLGWQSIDSFTTWTEGVQSFSGVPLANLMEAVGVTGGQFRAIALNDYSVTIPVSDIEEYNVFLALDRNGTPMRVRDKGPSWIIYPRNAALEGSGPHDSKMIWQLKQIEVLAE